MSFRWTETLLPPLARVARDGEWDRIDEARGGGWLFLSAEHTHRGTAWYHLAPDSDHLDRLSILEDLRLPQVGELVDEWLTAGDSVHLLAWRVGRRAVFRVTGEHGTRICKVYHKESHVEERWSLLEDQGDEQWTTPRICAWDARRRLLTVSVCPGVSLHQRWMSGAGRASDGDLIGDLLGWLARSEAHENFPRHTAADEILLLDKRVKIFEDCLLEPTPRARALNERVAQALAQETDARTALCHRDLHDKQVLLSGDRGCLIDLDVLAVGPPALDPGNILAHARLRALRGADLPWEGIAGRVAQRASQERDIGDSLHRWTAAALMRLSLIYARRERSEGLLEQLLASTEQALDRSGEWRGIL